MTPVIDFAIVPEPGSAAVAGLIASGTSRAALHAKVLERAAHYEHLSVAIGDGWTALIATENIEVAQWPWLSEPPVFLYAIGRGGYCQMGYRPNVPGPLHDQFLQALRREYKLTGPIALTIDRLYDLSEARPLADVDLKVLR